MDLFFGHGAAWFSVPAFLGTFFFLLRLGLMFVGGDTDVDTDVDADIDIDGDFDASDSDSTSAFKVLSIQTIATFMMGFGWGGLGGFKGAGWGVGILGAISILFGILLLANYMKFTISLPWAVGILAIVGGIAAIVMAFRLK